MNIGHALQYSDLLTQHDSHGSSGNLSCKWLEPITRGTLWRLAEEPGQERRREGSTLLYHPFRRYARGVWSLEFLWKALMHTIDEYFTYSTHLKQSRVI